MTRSEQVGSGEVLQSVDDPFDAQLIISALARVGIRSYISRSLSTRRYGVVVEIPFNSVYGPTESAVRAALETAICNR